MILHSENRFKKWCRKCKKTYKKKKSLEKHETGCMFDNLIDNRVFRRLGYVETESEIDPELMVNVLRNLENQDYENELDLSEMSSELYDDSDSISMNIDEDNVDDENISDNVDGLSDQEDVGEDLGINNTVDVIDPVSIDLNITPVEMNDNDINNIEDGIQDHHINATGEETISYTCDSCGENFDKVWSMYRHKKSCKPVNFVRLAKSVLQMFHLQIQESKRCLRKKIEVAKQLKSFLQSNNCLDDEYLNWLGKELKLGGTVDVKIFLSYADKCTNLGGRPDKINDDMKIKVINFWKDHCQISVDRRNNRQVVNMKLKKMPKIVKDVLKYDDEISIVETKRGKKYQAHRHVYTAPIRKLFHDFSNTGINISIGSFLKLKPFYILPPTTREMASCLCIKCVNIHLIYDGIRTHKRDLPPSLTQYLTSTMKCSLDEKIDFVQLDCIHGKCKNSCTTVQNQLINSEDKIMYYVFEKCMTIGWNREGKKYEYERTAHVNTSATLNELFQKLHESTESYLVHRYNVAVDKVFWKEFSEVCQMNIFHIDYSENIKLKPKYEAQSAHFSGRQHTLHCCVHQKGDENRYIYHLSDDTNHQYYD